MLHRPRADDRGGHGRVADHEGQRHLDQRHARLVRQLAQSIGGVELALVAGQRHVVAAGDHLRPPRLRDVRVLAVLAGEPAAGQRAPGDHAHAVAAARGQDVGLDGAGEQRVGRLLAHEALAAALLGDPLGLDDLAGRERRRPDVANLPLAHQVGQRAERFVDIRVFLGAVDLVQVDPVRAQPAQAVLHFTDDPAARVAELVRVVAHLAVDLGGQDDVVALPVRERLAHDLLRLAARVHVGGVDEVDPGVERAVDDADRRVVVGLAPGAEHHRAEAERADAYTGPAEASILHGRTLTGGLSRPCARSVSAPAPRVVPFEQPNLRGEIPMARNLANFLSDSAEQHGDRTALKLDDAEVTYKQLDEASGRAAALLKSKGFEDGDRVGIMLPNVPYFAIVYYGVLRAGAVVVPMNPLLKGREVSFYLEDPGAKLMFAWHDFAEAADKGAEEAGAEVIPVKPGEFEKLLGEHDPDTEVVDREDDDTAVILYTSGTTGKPKGAELTHANLRENVRVTADTLAQIDEDDMLLGALPLFHSFGQTCGLNTAIFKGACMTMIPRFDPDKALEIIERDKVTVFEGVPTMYTAMLHADSKDDHDTSCLRVCISGGSAMPVEVLKGFEKEFDCKVLEGYGLSETSPVASFNHPDRERKPGSIGTPIEGVEMKVVDEDGNEVDQGEVGEIVIKGHNVMKGYWNREDATKEAIKDGWFHSGDMAKVDEDGYFQIVDRKKEMIIRGGYNVYPREIEEVIYEHPAVQTCAVIGIPDDKMGEEVGAAVVLKQGEDLSEDELRDYVKNEVANYKYPRKIWFVDELPMGPTGKILKREIEVPETVQAG